MAGDYPGVPFVQARYYSRGRPGPIKWIVMHTMEAHELSTTAESTAAYFANPGDGRTVSSHLCVDNNSVVQCVLEKDTAYTAGGNPGNGQGFNVEQAGFARQTRAEWLDDYSLAMFRQEAPVLRDVAVRNGIPFKYVDWRGLRAGEKGFTTHNDCRLAWGGTTHTDPGVNFPWDVFLPIVEEGTDVAGFGYKTQEQADDVWRRTGSMQRILGETVVPALDALKIELAAVMAKLNELEAAIAEIDCGDVVGSGSVTIGGTGTFTLTSEPSE